MKYNTWKEVPYKGKLRVVQNSNSNNYKLNHVYDYDLQNIAYHNDDADCLHAKDIIYSYPKGNFLSVKDVKFIEEKITISKDFKKMFKQL